ncbi:receptor protein kinase-like protein ZAR1 [Canna indica]|uniref:Receptor protein kinase-like protein ZAR1 n=1 Tax=Canna indica TaxID=4628 RepID=A0AAQ3QM50_9LILI|nr:receptor protein kinase-like protein ZAR1 [Canna indica]
MRRRRLYLFTIIFYIIHVLRRCPALSPDGLALLALKAAVSDDPSSSLSEWNQDDYNPCRWPGITCANATGFAYPRVVGVSVSGKNLSGHIPSEIGTLLFLRRLNLHGNRFSGTIPPQLFNASSLHSLFLYDNLLSGAFPAAACDLPRLQNLDLSRNALSGPLPPVLRGCRQLQRLRLAGNRLSGEIPARIWADIVSLVQLDLSSNGFTGRLPPDLGELDSLATLNLSHNHFSGSIPTSLGNLPSTVSLDLRYNNLSGEIPDFGSLANQGPTAFFDNPGLCGFPLMVPCERPATPAAETPEGGRGAEFAAMGNEGRKGISTGLIVLISAADVAGVALLGLLVVCAYWKVRGKEECSAKTGGGGKGLGRRGWCGWPCAEAGEENGEGPSSGEEVYDEEEGGGSGVGGVEGELVTMDKGFKVDLDELLRASAYVLGKGGKGIVYKVVVGNGEAVAVRRLGEGGGGGGRYKEFAAEVRAMGRVRHPNLVRLRAFYWAADEKLLIADFIANGNLSGAIRGRSGHVSLPWSARLSIARGAARGLAHLHDCSPRKFVHGDLKPSNILLDADFNPYISDFGLLRLLSLITSPSSSSANPTSAPSSSSFSSTTGLIGAALPFSSSSSKSGLLERPNPYRAPETRAAVSRFTQKSDVYSFGVVLLEMLTGKPPEMSPSPASSGEQLVPGLVKWVRKVFDETRPLSEVLDPVLLQDGNAKKEVVAAFHVALACTEMDPDARPRMKTVSEDLEKIGSSRK